LFAVNYSSSRVATGHSPVKLGKVGEFDTGQGKVREIVVCLQCAVAVAY